MPLRSGLLRGPSGTLSRAPHHAAQFLPRGPNVGLSLCHCFGQALAHGTRRFVIRGQLLSRGLQAGQGLGQLARRIVGALAGRHAFYAAAGALASPRASTALA